MTNITNNTPTTRSESHIKYNTDGSYDLHVVTTQIYKNIGANICTHGENCDYLPCKLPQILSSLQLNSCSNNMKSTDSPYNPQQITHQLPQLTFSGSYPTQQTQQMQHVPQIQQMQHVPQIQHVQHMPQIQHTQHMPQIQHVQHTPQIQYAPQIQHAQQIQHMPQSYTYHTTQHQYPQQTLHQDVYDPNHIQQTLHQDVYDLNHTQQFVDPQNNIPDKKFFSKHPNKNYKNKRDKNNNDKTNINGTENTFDTRSPCKFGSSCIFGKKCMYKHST